jgi:hypothetical protein
MDEHYGKYLENPVRRIKLQLSGFKFNQNVKTKFLQSFGNGRSPARMLAQSDARYKFGDLRLHRLDWIMWLRDCGGHFYHTG